MQRNTSHVDGYSLLCIAICDPICLVGYWAKKMIIDVESAGSVCDEEIVEGT
ncbi:hypothetical protein BDR05DRAFT_970163 [Suillus weaverae]|nr:hypothetical protein BDR05DRAFT_970163 [Suillus weaverae]